MRRNGATRMQALGILPDIIDRCQNHVLAGSRVRRHHLHHEILGGEMAVVARPSSGPLPVVSLERRDRAFCVGDHGRTTSIHNLLPQAGRFGLPAADARAEIDSLAGVVRHWRESFLACGVSARDIDHFAPAFLSDCFIFENRPEA